MSSSTLAGILADALALLARLELHGGDEAEALRITQAALQEASARDAMKSSIQRARESLENEQRAWANMLGPHDGGAARRSVEERIAARKANRAAGVKASGPGSGEIMQGLVSVAQANVNAAGKPGTPALVDGMDDRCRNCWVSFRHHAKLGCEDWKEPKRG